MLVTDGSSSCSSSSRFGASSRAKLVTPVTLPPGRLRLATSPTSTGSTPTPKTIGISPVAALAASAEAVPPALTRTATRSAAGRHRPPLRPSGRRAGRERSLLPMAPRRRLGRKDDRGSWSASLPACLRGLLDRFTNAHIGAAATDIAGHRRVDVGIAGMRVAREQRRSGHDLAGLAVAALHDLAIEPGLLDPGARRGRADRFDRRDRGAADAIDRSDAGADGDAVKMHGAGAAQCHAAAELRSGHTEDIAQ